MAKKLVGKENMKVATTGNDIIIDDGSKSYNIKNKTGDILGEFKFRPADTNIVRRYEEAVKSLEDLKEPTGENNEEKMMAMEDAIVKQIDYLINASSKEAFFTIMGPLSPLANGEFFVESCLDAIKAIIEKELGARTKKVKARINKYAAKYHS